MFSDNIRRARKLADVIMFDGAAGRVAYDLSIFIPSVISEEKMILPIAYSLAVGDTTESMQEILKQIQSIMGIEKVVDVAETHLRNGRQSEWRQGGRNN